MKNGIITLILVLVCTTGFSQNYKFQYAGRFTPQVKTEKLNEVKLILDETKKMPKWKPAKNSEGIKIKQEFSIPFGGGGC